MIHLATFTDENMTISAEICANSAQRHGVDQAWTWNRAALMQTEFYQENKVLLDQPRGCGYWAWKPFIILRTMQAAADGDIVIYADAGVEFIESVNHIISRMNDIWLFANMWQHIYWCKADTMKALNCWDSGNQVQASVIFIRNSKQMRDFVSEWLEWCTIPYLIDDSASKCANHPEFQEHRHDQAILTTMAYREKIPFHWWPAMYNAGAFTYDKQGFRDNYPVLFHHHRRRNEDWIKTDPLNKQITDYFKRRNYDIKL